jgi:hypothetical protein
MRRVAEALGVGTMSLGVGTETLGRGMWRPYVRHPWPPFVNQSRPLLGPNSLDGFEFALHGLDDSGLTSQQKVNAIGLIEAFVSSAARVHHNAATAELRTDLSTEEFWGAQAPVMGKAMSTGRYPLIATLDEDAFASTAEEVFEFGLRCLLDGLEALVDSRHEGAAPDR